MKFKDMVRNWVYGKPDKRDFTEADLPESRVALFWHVLNNRLGKMVGMNLLYLLIWLPAIAWSFINVLQLNAILQLPAEELRATLEQALYNWFLILFPLIALTGPFNVAISDVFRRWARDEHCFPLSTFGAALKANWKQGLLYGLLDGALPLLFFLSARFYLALMRNSAVFVAAVVLLIVLAVLWLLASPLIPMLIVSYELSFLGVLKNAFLMTLVSLPLSFLMRLATLALPILLALALRFVPVAAAYIILFGSLLYLVILLSFNKLLWASYANALGEKYLNSRIPGARTNIGLRPEHHD